MSLFEWIYFISLMLFVIFTICLAVKLVLGEADDYVKHRNFKKIIDCHIKDCDFQDGTGDYDTLKNRIMYSFERQKKIKIFAQDESLMELLLRYLNEFCLAKENNKDLCNKRKIIFNLIKDMEQSNNFLMLPKENATAFINTAEYIKNDKKDDAIKMLTEISEKYASLLKEVKQYKTRKTTVIISIITAAATIVGSIGTVILAMK